MSFGGHGDRTGFPRAHVNRNSETNQSLGLCLQLGWVRWEFDFTEGSLLILLMSEINQQRLRCMPISAGNSLLLLFWGRVDFSGLSLRPSFLPKSSPGVFNLKLERSYESAGKSLFIMNYTTPHGPAHSLPLGPHPSVVSWAFRHVGHVSGFSCR